MQIGLIVKAQKCNLRSRMWIFLLTFAFKKTHKPHKPHKPQKAQKKNKEITKELFMVNC